MNAPRIVLKHISAKALTHTRTTALKRAPGTTLIHVWGMALTYVSLEIQFREIRENLSPRCDGSSHYYL